MRGVRFPAMIGLLIFLGLLGTFWGTETIGSVGQVVEGLDLGSTDFDQMMTQLRTELDAPLVWPAFSLPYSVLPARLSLAFWICSSVRQWAVSLMRLSGYLPLPVTMM